MEYSYQDNMKKTISEVFPAYLKKELLKQAVDDGLVINNRKKTLQLSLFGGDIIDVSEYDSLDEKIDNILQVDNVLQFIEEFEYRRQYRHFCYFKCSEIDPTKIEDLVKRNTVNLFVKKGNSFVDEYEKPSLYIVDNLVYLKFAKLLNNDVGNQINFIVICVLDKENNIIELRFDRVGIAYKNSYNFYRDKINEILQYLCDILDITIENIDFKAVIDYIKMEKDNIMLKECNVMAPQLIWKHMMMVMALCQF